MKYIVEELYLMRKWQILIHGIFQSQLPSCPFIGFILNPEVFRRKDFIGPFFTGRFQMSMVWSWCVFFYIIWRRDGA